MLTRVLLERSGRIWSCQSAVMECCSWNLELTRHRRAVVCWLGGWEVMGSALWLSRSTDSQIVGAVRFLCRWALMKTMWCFFCMSFTSGGAASHLQVAQQVKIPKSCNVRSEGGNLRNAACGVEIFWKRRCNTLEPETSLKTTPRGFGKVREDQCVFAFAVSTCIYRTCLCLF